MEEQEFFPRMLLIELRRSNPFSKTSKDDRNCRNGGDNWGTRKSCRMQFCSRRRSAGSFRSRLFVVLSLFFHILAFPTAAEDSRFLSSRFSPVVRISYSDLQNRLNLDQNIQQAAFRQFDRHKTGRVYNVSVSIPGISGDSIFQAIRLRVGSFKKYGVNINEFTIPQGCEVTPAPRRILLVYARLTNTSLFQNLPGGLFLASPVVSVLAYDASNLSSIGQPAMLSVVSSTAISVQIQPLSSAASNFSCVLFDDKSTNVNYSAFLQRACDINHFGTVALASTSPINVSAPPPATSPVNASAPAPAMSPVVAPFPQSHQSSKAWKIAVGSVIGGLALLALAGALALAVSQRRRNAKFAMMLHKADQGESLQTSVIRNSRAPTAGSTRTQPILERTDAL